MKIERVEALHLRLPTVREIFDGTQEVLIVRVATDEGYVGYGEVVSCSAVAKAAIEAPKSAPTRHGLAVALTGADPLDPAACWQIMYDASRWYGRQGVVLHAMSGIDQALWDIAGKVANKPTSALWGQRRKKVRAYASMLFPESPKEAAAITRRCIESGFTAVKFGYGSFGRDCDHDFALCEAIEKAARGAADVIIDAGRVWSTEQAASRARELFEHFPLLWIEEPLHEDNVEGYATVAAAVSGRIAAGEAESTVKPFDELLKRGVKVVQPDAGRAGGMATCLEVSRHASKANAWCVPHCYGTGVQLAASLHWMISADEAPFLEFPVAASELRNKLVINAPEQVDGWVTVSDTPGLGVDLDSDVLRQYHLP
jgi:L-alanine-DL-glutamate epimerase-like enolase superfamily enzyme